MKEKEIRKSGINKGIKNERKEWKWKKRIRNKREKEIRKRGINK